MRFPTDRCDADPVVFRVKLPDGRVYRLPYACQRDAVVSYRRASDRTYHRCIYHANPLKTCGTAL